MERGDFKEEIKNNLRKLHFHCYAYYPPCLSNEEKNIINALQMWKVVVINTFHNVKLDLNGGFVETYRTEELF